MAAEDGCLICAMEAAAEDVVVFRDELWAAEIVPGYDVPGWFVLRARRHAERLTGLDNGELATFGRRARDLVAAVTDVFGVPATYLLIFGEAYPHLHALIAPRGEDVPPEFRTGNLLQLREARADPQAAARLVPQVRAAYERARSEVLAPSLG